MQICSSIQNQDFSVVQDYITGLKCALYLRSRDDQDQWEYQSAATRVNPEELYAKQGSGLPRFGPYERKRKALRKSAWLAKDLQAREPHPSVPKIPGKVVTLSDLLGASLPRIGAYNDLNIKEQVHHHPPIMPLREAALPKHHIWEQFITRWSPWSMRTLASTVASVT